jgi:HPt (histidine-containing phosphotransfer) domain-containing protein
MDACVAKPFRPQELFRVVEQIEPLQLAGDAEGDGADQSVIAEPPKKPLTTAGETFEFDRNEALKRVGGDENILRELVQLFRVEGPKQLDEIHERHAAGDLTGLSRAAHTLKGSVAIFAAQAAYDAALRIEKMGRAGDISEFDQAWDNLQAAIERLMSAFEKEFTSAKT